MRASRGLKWENKMYKPKRSILATAKRNVKIFGLQLDLRHTFDQLPPSVTP